MEETEKQTEKSKGNFWSKANEASEIGFMSLFTNLPFILFLIGLGVIHIANAHLAENYVRDIAKKEKQVQQLRWDYLFTSSEMMKQSKQSSVAGLVEKYGIKPLRIPPNIVEE
ncbi:MAG: hypothetical protein KF706_10600 [Chitinophagales bacterium]|nr:hypothetical protein [Chitinophagales bacterium]